MPVVTLQPRKRKSGFTLLEVLLATLMFAAIIAAINMVFTTAMRMRRTAYELVEQSVPEKYAVATIRRDLSGCVSTGGLLAGRFVGELNGGGVGGSPRLEFFTTTGTIRDDQPWPEIQRVRYYIAEANHIPGEEEDERGYQLIRGVYRNFLLEDTELPEEELLFRNVRQIEFYYFDGEDWQDIWDSEDLDSVLGAGASTPAEGEPARSTLPEAVQIRITFEAPDNNSNERVQNPVELMVAISSRGVAPDEEEEDD